MGKLIPRSFMQFTLWLLMVTTIAAVLMAAVYTNTTLKSVEENLPNTLLTELNALANVLDNLSRLSAAARIALESGKKEDLHQLFDLTDEAHESIITLRAMYLNPKLVNAPAFHAVVGPAIIDIKTWLNHGIYRYGPNSPVTLGVILERINGAYTKAKVLKSRSQINAQRILDQQVERLGKFQTSVTMLFVLTLFIVSFLIILLIRQTLVIGSEVRTKKELFREHNLVESLLQNLPLGVAVWEKNKNIVHLNHRFTEITGYDKSDMPTIFQWPQIAYPDPDYRKKVTMDWRRQDMNHRVGEYQVTCKNGEIKDIEFRGTALPDARIIHTLTDVTERNIKERELIEIRNREARFKKMESLGVLAGGVAHDLNNILSGMVTYPELILMDLKENDKLRKHIEVIRDSGQKATAIVEDLLTVARGVATPKEVFDINSIILEYLKSPEYYGLKRQQPAVLVATDLGTDLPCVIGSRVHMKKIIGHLISNGCEATSAGGTVRIATSNSASAPPDNTLPGNKETGYIHLTVTDQGAGISETDLERIFEPFYSKKVMGRSDTGLGLAVVWNVVQDHQGYINVSSSEKGTIFNLYLPVADSEETQQNPEATYADIMGEGERILIVDDVSSQRLITSSILEKLGFITVTAASGEDAVEKVQHTNFDIVILDMIMDPGIDGRETYERILKIHPNQKAIIVSGYAETSDVKMAMDLGASFFLKKPLEVLELGLAIKETLSQT